MIPNPLADKAKKLLMELNAWCDQHPEQSQQTMMMRPALNAISPLEPQVFGPVNSKKVNAERRKRQQRAKEVATIIQSLNGFPVELANSINGLLNDYSEADIQR